MCLRSPPGNCMVVSRCCFELKRTAKKKKVKKTYNERAERLFLPIKPIVLWPRSRSLLKMSGDWMVLTITRFVDRRSTRLSF